MSNVNSATISGNLTRDPELRHTPSGTAVCSMRLANNRRRKVNDEWVDETGYFDITVWGNFGELCAKKLEKGSAITCSGRLEWREWEAQDGSKRQAVQIVANEVDGQDFYKSGGEVKQTDGGGQTTMEPGSSQGTSDDDIPF